MDEATCTRLARKVLLEGAEGSFSTLLRSFDVRVQEGGVRPHAEGSGVSRLLGGGSGGAEEGAKAAGGRRMSGLPLPQLAVRCFECSRPPEGDPDYALLSSASAPSRALFRAPPSEIVLCRDHLGGEADVREVLRHESTHAVDSQVLHMDLTRCKPLACSEIRAAQAAECSGPMFEWARKGCVKRQASLATGMALGEKHGPYCVKKAFQACYDSDTATNPIQDQET